MAARRARAGHPRSAAGHAWAGHLVIVFPLWLGDMPALLKAFFEQTLRPGFVTMGMPGFFYRLYYGGHSVKSLKRSVLEFCGEKWPAKMAALGRKAG